MLSINEPNNSGIKVIRVDGLKSPKKQNKTQKNINTDYLKNIIRNNTEEGKNSNKTSRSKTILEIKKLLESKKTKKNMNNLNNTSSGQNIDKNILKKKEIIKQKVEKKKAKKENKSLLERIQNNLDKKKDKKIEKREHKINKLLEKPKLKFKNKVKNRKLMNLIKKSTNIVLTSKNKGKNKKNKKQRQTKKQKKIIKSDIYDSENIYHSAISKITDKKLKKKDKFSNIKLEEMKKELIENNLIDKNSNAPKKIIQDIYKLYSLSKNIMIK